MGASILAGVIGLFCIGTLFVDSKGYQKDDDAESPMFYRRSVYHYGNHGPFPAGGFSAGPGSRGPNCKGDAQCWSQALGAPRSPSSRL